MFSNLKFKNIIYFSSFVLIVNIKIYSATIINTTETLYPRVINAISAGNLTNLEELIVSGFDVNKRYDGIPILFMLINNKSGKKKEMAELLLRLGADPLLASQIGASFLNAVIINKDVELLKVLLSNFKEKGVDVNEIDPNEPLLFQAIRTNNKDIVELLVDYGADVNKMTLRGDTPVFVANTPEIVRMLLDRGAEIKASEFEALQRLDETFPNYKFKTITQMIKEEPKRKQAIKERTERMDLELKEKTGLPKDLLNIVRSYMLSPIKDYEESLQETVSEKNVNTGAFGFL